MIKNLLLVRHAQAESPAAVIKDVERELTSSGSIEAFRMGKRMYELGMRPDLIIASNARRTIATAELVAEQLQYSVDAIVPQEGLYDSSLRNLMQVISTIKEKHSQVVLVAHNPTLTYLAEYLTNEIIGSLPTCGTVNIQFENQSWAEVTGKSGKLVWFEYPNTNTPISDDDEL